MPLKGRVKIITNLKTDLDDEKGKSDANSEREETIQNKPDIRSIKEHKQDVKVIRTKPNIKKEEMMESKPDTHEEEKTALILGMRLSLRYGGCSNDLFPSGFCHKIRVYQNSNTCYKCPQILRFLRILNKQPLPLLYSKSIKVLNP